MRRSPGAEEPLPYNVSVVIPTHDRPRAIVRCLDALAEQTPRAGTFEVIVVDDGSVPHVALEPSRWAARFPLTVISQPNGGPAAARNRGAAEARGVCLAFTDDDCVPTPEWLERLVAALERDAEALVGGSTVNGLADDLYAEASQLILELVYEHFNHDPRSAYFFASNNFALRRDRYLQCGGFDADFDSPAAEDREFCDRWRMQARPLVWEKRAVIEHEHAQSLGAFVRLHWRYGQGAFLYQAKRRERGSGTMLDDLGFHRRLPRVMWAKLARYPVTARLQLTWNLFLWQLANAAGFVQAWLCGPPRRGKRAHTGPT